MADDNEEFEDVEDSDDVIIVRGPASIIDKFFGGEGIESSDDGGDQEGGDDGGTEGGDSEEARFARFKEWEDAQSKTTPLRRRRRSGGKRVERDTGTEGRGRRGYFD